MDGADLAIGPEARPNRRPSELPCAREPGGCPCFPDCRRWIRRDSRRHFHFHYRRQLPLRLAGVFPPRSLDVLPPRLPRAFPPRFDALPPRLPAFPEPRLGALAVPPPRLSSPLPLSRRASSPDVSLTHDWAERCRGRRRSGREYLHAHPAPPESSLGCPNASTEIVRDAKTRMDVRRMLRLRVGEFHDGLQIPT